MFLSLLSKPQKRAFWALANAFIGADGTVEASESAMLHLMLQEMELPTEPQVNRKTIGSLAKAFTTHRSQVVALLEIIGLGHADTTYSAKECEFVTALAKEFGISQKELIKMEKWVKRQVELMTEAHTMLNLEEK